MSLAQPEHPDNRPNPGLTLNLSSNNPFRNRAASPPFSSSQPSPLDPPRLVSTNPFLDTSSTNILQQAPFASPDKMSSRTDATTALRPALTGNAADLFDSLTLNDTGSNGMRPPPTQSQAGDRVLPGPSRPENVPPRGLLTHRPSHSQEEAMRVRKGTAPPPYEARLGKDELNIFADPSESPRKMGPRRVRRNSESSVMERSGKLLDPEDERRRQERRRRERRHREREGKDPKGKKPDRKLDIIDKLDVTSIYGTGLFHHDGPFDACNPHRNRQGSRRAPMQAFPKDSLNNALGGGGPLNKRPDHATFLGNNDEEAFKDYSKGGAGSFGYEPYSNGVIRPGPSRAESNVINMTARIEPIHGDETLGLGTSTFLEGAPASRTAIQRRESEQTSVPTEGGLARKKSLAQKIRGISNNRRDYGPPGRIISPDGVYNTTSPDPPTYTSSGSVGKINERNPFFIEYEEGTKGESITIVEPESKTGRARAPSSPRRGFGERLERRVTSDGSVGFDEAPKSGGSFLSRVKSLKGGPRKPRGEKPLPQPQVL